MRVVWRCCCSPVIAREGCAAAASAAQYARTLFIGRCKASSAQVPGTYPVVVHWLVRWAEVLLAPLMGCFPPFCWSGIWSHDSV